MKNDGPEKAALLGNTMMFRTGKKTGFFIKDILSLIFKKYRFNISELIESVRNKQTPEKEPISHHIFNNMIIIAVL